MKGLLLLHVSAALFVSLLMGFGGMSWLALAIAAYAILIALNRTFGILDAVAYLVVGAFTAGFVLLAVLNFDSGKHFVAAVIIVGLAASWTWTLWRQPRRA